MVKLRAFKAIDDPETCKKFLKGHGEILTNIGVNKVTSSQASWVENPGTYVLVVEDIDSHEVLGGARIDTSYGNQRLPIASATADMDPKILGLIEKEAKQGTGEICGLWNSRKVAGMGFGSHYLTRAAVALSALVEVKSLFALAAPYTISIAKYFGYKIIYDVGNDGTFYYPKLDLLATAMKLDDTVVLDSADDFEKERVNSLRVDPTQTFKETLKRREVTVKYDLQI